MRILKCDRCGKEINEKKDLCFHMPEWVQSTPVKNLKLSPSGGFDFCEECGKELNAWILNKILDKEVIDFIEDAKRDFKVSGEENEHMVSIPEKATNGDAIKALFPNVIMPLSKSDVTVHTRLGNKVQDFDKRWWKLPYVKE